MSAIKSEKNITEVEAAELPFVTNILMFVLYTICFASLYHPNLEVIGFSLFFALHIIMSVIMIQRISAIKPAPASLKPFKWLSIPLSWLSIPLSWPIFGGLILLFVSLLLLIITFVSLNAIYTKTGVPAKDGLNFFFHKNQLELVSKKDDFKCIAITTTVLLWAQYLLYANYKFFNLIFKNLDNNVAKLTTSPDKSTTTITQLLLYLFGSVIILLSSASVVLTHQMWSKTGSIIDPPLSQ